MVKQQETTTEDVMSEEVVKQQETTTEDVMSEEVVEPTGETMKKRVVITGAGIIASNGKGKEEFWQNLQDGKTGYRPITLFETGDFLVNMAGEITDFDASLYVGKKGLRLLDRSTRLLISAAHLAIADSQLQITDDNTDDVGVSVGTTFGSLKSISDFDEVTLREGPRYTNPALFPNTVINSPASQVSIWNNIQGFNTTISTGFTSSIDAMSYAYDFLQMERVKVVYTGSVEELCRQTYDGFHSLQFLSGSKQGEAFVNCPFDKRRNGITLGEGAGLISMEDHAHAVERKAPVLAEVLGFGYSFDPFRIHKYNPRGTGLKESLRQALENAQLELKDIDYICANANSTQAADRIETQAIKEVFGEWAYKIPVSSIKSMTGECFSVSGTFAVIASLGALAKDFIPPTVNYKEKDPECDLDYVPNVARKARLNNILIITFGPNGSNSCMVIGRYRG
ncbi:MAG: beta-ketoacyl-[acyl-carrier-protein] synthase family protein [Candidatus Omnitrophica bacterium]|nr:beta-ketoacyl-[acyl-carrier-protein] synthase family protein [Candidatus Omnitrophota bacterium]